MEDKIHTQLIEYYGMSKETGALYSVLAERSGMSDGMFWSLYIIRVFGSCTQRDICQIWAMSKQTVHSALQKLQREGYISVQVQNTDKRRKVICLTKHGVQYAELHIDPIFSAEKSAFREMTADERNELLALSHKLQFLLKSNMKKLLDSPVVHKKEE